MTEVTITVAEASADGGQDPGDTLTAVRSAAGLDVALSVNGDVTTLTMPGGLTQTLATRINSGIYQIAAAQINGVTFAANDDEFAPCLIRTGEINEWLGGNHAMAGWRTAKGTLAAADIGKVWESGSDRITLLDVDGTYAYWSYVHNAGVTSGSSSAPSGTWTRGGSPSVDFTSAASSEALIVCPVTSDTGPVWTAGRSRVQWRRVVQELVPWTVYVTAQQASVGTKIDPESLTGVATLTSHWRWPGDQPGIIIVDVEVAAASTIEIRQWSGLQMKICDQVAFVGVTADHALDTWTSTPGAVSTPSDKWDDSTPPSVGMTRNTTAGGVCVGILATSADRSALTDPLKTNSSSKTYPVALGLGGVSSLTDGQTATVRGFRSLTTEASDRHTHVVTDPVTGVTRWYLIAGSTGTSWHPAMSALVGSRVTQSRGTATVADHVGSDGLTVTGAGWAEGTIAW